jgi:hypothetical protein
MACGTLQALLADELHLAEGFVFTVHPHTPLQLMQAQVGTHVLAVNSSPWMQSC